MDVDSRRDGLSVLAVIPARFASSRFPGKPLADIAGKPMIQRVVEQAKKVPGFTDVIVATDDDRIADVVQSFGGCVEMTRPDHPSGTDRVWEVAQKYENHDYIFNIQGDEPLINPLYLEEAVTFLKFHHGDVDIVTLKVKLRRADEIEDNNVVKVVTAENGKALYFSRAPIPHVRDTADLEADPMPYYKHIGVYGFKRQALQNFVSLPVSPLERLEKLEQLRALEAGYTIVALPVQEAPIGVDTPEDLNRINQIFATQQLS